MKSMKQKDQAHGYVRDAVIRTILGHYKTKLEDLSMEELEEELYAEEETTAFGEIPAYRPSDEQIKTRAEELIRRARLEGFIITPKISENDERMLSKWQRHEQYSKRKSRDMPRHQQNASEKLGRQERFTEDLESARKENNELFIKAKEQYMRNEFQQELKEAQ